MDLIKQLEDASGDALDKCRALWVLITTENKDAVVALVEPGQLTQDAGFIRSGQRHTRPVTFNRPLE